MGWRGYCDTWRRMLCLAGVKWALRHGQAAGWPLRLQALMRAYLCVMRWGLAAC